jgi:hypothetical protein
VPLLLAGDASVAARTRVGAKPAVRPPGAGGGSHGVAMLCGTPVAALNRMVDADVQTFPPAHKFVMGSEVIFRGHTAGPERMTRSKLLYPTGMRLLPSRCAVLLLAALVVGCGGGQPAGDRADEASPGVAPATGSGHITGVVFEDTNLNGTFDTGDVRMPQQTVLLTDPAGSQQIQSATTGADGSFRFEALGAGDYRVTMQVPDDYQRANDSSFVLTVPEGGSPAEVQFGLAPRKN